jgi:hypothetical protein
MLLPAMAPMPCGTAPGRGGATRSCWCYRGSTPPPGAAGASAAASAASSQPIVTARSLASALSVTPQAALGLIRQLIAAGILREATGRRACRAFVLA